MKRFCFYIILTAAVLNFYSCKRKDNYFNGEITISDFSKAVDTLKCESNLAFDGLYADAIYSYDSILFFISEKFPDKKINVFSLNSKKLIGEFFSKGNGPDEAIAIRTYAQYLNLDNEVKILMNINNSKLTYFNLTKSINCGKTILDSAYISLKMLKNLKGPFINVFALDSSHILIKTSSQTLNKDNSEYLPGEYQIYDSKSSKLIRKIKIFNKGINNINIGSDFSVEQFFSSFDVIKPDRSKIAMAMMSMAQLNILDTKTGKIKGFRLHNTPDFEYLRKNTEDLLFFYRYISADDKYIYVPYLNTPYKDGMGFLNQTNIIHVFDWEGQFIKKIYLERPFFDFTVNQKNMMLYTIDNEDKIYSYNIRKM